eukprot:1141969-Pelagomonas_calceolata.AAC.2
MHLARKVLLCVARSSYLDRQCAAPLTTVCAQIGSHVCDPEPFYCATEHVKLLEGPFIVPLDMSRCWKALPQGRCRLYIQFVLPLFSSITHHTHSYKIINQDKAGEKGGKWQGNTVAHGWHSQKKHRSRRRMAKPKCFRRRAAKGDCYMVRMARQHCYAADWPGSTAT